MGWLEKKRWVAQIEFAHEHGKSRRRDKPVRVRHKVPRSRRVLRRAYVEIAGSRRHADRGGAPEVLRNRRTSMGACRKSANPACDRTARPRSHWFRAEQELN